MNWRVGIATAIMLLWAYLLLTSGPNPDDRWRFDALTPFAFAAITFILAEPVVREHRDRKRRRHRDDDDD